MIATLRNSVDKLQGLLASLTGDTPRTGSAATEHADVSKLVTSFVQEKRRLGLNVNVSSTAAGNWAQINDTNAFLAVLEHILSNALEASPADTPVAVRVSKKSGFVCVVIEDEGPGMSGQFIADELFRPRKSTKSSGFGLGAYQAREIMRDLGGDIEVLSKLGQGTAVTLTVPEFVSEFEVV
jgi:signal transduction histidine kinase